MMEDSHTVDRPIFIVGSGRSGSTLLYRVMGGHPCLAWFSNFSTRLPGFPQIAYLGRLYRLRQRYPWPRLISRLMPVPSEAYEVWDDCKPVEGSPDDPPLTELDLTQRERACIQSVVAAHVRWQGARRFINKNTRNTRRIEYLNAIFPDSLFIHLIRDPRAAAASLLNVDWWPEIKVWCHDNITPDEWAAQGKVPAMLAAIIWREENRYVLDRQSMLGERYLRLHYEDLVGDPWGVIKTVLAHCDLQVNGDFERFVHHFSIKNMNYKYRQQFDDSLQAQIMLETAPILARLGYNYF